jgi:excisionase family DNA binding protein
MTVGKIADRLDVSVRTVRRLIAEGSLKSIKVGSRVFVTNVALVHFLAGCGYRKGGASVQHR